MSLARHQIGNDGNVISILSPHTMYSSRTVPAWASRSASHISQ
jgi:hypothetical protein